MSEVNNDDIYFKKSEALFAKLKMQEQYLFNPISHIDNMMHNWMTKYNFSDNIKNKQVYENKPKQKISTNKVLFKKYDNLINGENEDVLVKKNFEKIIEDANSNIRSVRVTKRNEYQNKFIVAYNSVANVEKGFNYLSNIFSNVSSSKNYERNEKSFDDYFRDNCYYKMAINKKNGESSLNEINSHEHDYACIKYLINNYSEKNIMKVGTKVKTNKKEIIDIFDYDNKFNSIIKKADNKFNSYFQTKENLQHIKIPVKELMIKNINDYFIKELNAAYTSMFNETGKKLKSLEGKNVRKIPLIRKIKDLFPETISEHKVDLMNILNKLSDYVDGLKIGTLINDPLIKDMNDTDWYDKYGEKLKEEFNNSNLSNSELDTTNSGATTSSSSSSPIPAPRKQNISSKQVRKISTGTNTNTLYSIDNSNILGQRVNKNIISGNSESAKVKNNSLSNQKLVDEFTNTAIIIKENKKTVTDKAITVDKETTIDKGILSCLRNDKESRNINGKRTIDELSKNAINTSVKNGKEVNFKIGNDNFSNSLNNSKEDFGHSSPKDKKNIVHKKYIDENKENERVMLRKTLIQKKYFKTIAEYEEYLKARRGLRNIQSELDAEKKLIEKVENLCDFNKYNDVQLLNYIKDYPEIVKKAINDLSEEYNDETTNDAYEKIKKFEKKEKLIKNIEKNLKQTKIEVKVGKTSLNNINYQAYRIQNPAVVINNKNINQNILANNYNIKNYNKEINSNGIATGNKKIIAGDHNIQQSIVALNSVTNVEEMPGTIVKNAVSSAKANFSSPKQITKLESFQKVAPSLHVADIASVRSNKSSMIGGETPIKNMAKYFGETQVNNKFYSHNFNSTTIVNPVKRVGEKSLTLNADYNIERISEKIYDTQSPSVIKRAKNSSMLRLPKNGIFVEEKEIYKSNKNTHSYEYENDYAGSSRSSFLKTHNKEHSLVTGINNEKSSFKFDNFNDLKRFKIKPKI